MTGAVATSGISTLWVEVGAPAGAGADPCSAPHGGVFDAGAGGSNDAGACANGLAAGVGGNGGGSSDVRTQPRAKGGIIGVPGSNGRLLVAGGGGAGGGGDHQAPDFTPCGDRVGGAVGAAGGNGAGAGAGGNASAEGAGQVAAPAG